MAKEIIAIAIIIFWLAFPFAVISMKGINAIKTLDVSNNENLQQPTTESIFGINTTGFTLWDYVSVYFNAMYMSVDNSPTFLSLIILILQLMSGLIIFLLVRGG